jgi:predicted transcriptional regulator
MIQEKKMNNLELEIIHKRQAKPPVNIVDIARDLGINVYEGKSKDNVAGKIIKDSKLGGKSGYAIFVNQEDKPYRQRFTIAHEIAHFLKHKDLIGDGIVDDALYRSGLSNQIEAEANKIAAEILMPWHLVNEELNNDPKSVKELADKFHVSESAMAIRLGIPG